MNHITLYEFGYDHIIMGDCWQSMERDPTNGTIQADATRFPSGIANLSEYVKNNTQHFGLVLGSGSKTCMGYTGSLNNEMKDAKTIGVWGVEYLKYDNCYAEGVPAKTRYTNMGTALNETRGGGYGYIYYDVDNWGNADVASWAPGIADSWTTTIPLGVSNIPENSFA
jgi:alpha-galactosidase